DPVQHLANGRAHPSVIHNGCSRATRKVVSRWRNGCRANHWRGNRARVRRSSVRATRSDQFPILHRGRVEDHLRSVALSCFCAPSTGGARRTIKSMRGSQTAGCLFAAAIACAAQTMPADYDAVLKTLGKQGDYKSNVLKI